MTYIPLNASIECNDGPCGKSEAIIVDPTTKKITHIVVKGETIPEGRLVGIDEVSEVISDVVMLSCTKGDLLEMDPFTETHYVKTQVPADMYYDTYNLPYVFPAAPLEVEVPMDEELIPPGDLAIHRGTPVEATDGYIGEVGEFMIDLDSGKISHFLLLESHLWGKKEISLPVSVVDHISGDTVYLKIDNKSVNMLPEIPVKREYYEQEAHAKQLELIAFISDNPGDANDTLKFLTGLSKTGILEIKNASVIVKDKDGNTKVEEKGDVDPRQGTIFGAITGGLIGLIGGPVGLVVGAAAGAATGRVAARKIDMGFSNDFLQKIEDELQPGKSALIVLVEHEIKQELSAALADIEGLYFNEQITDEVVEELITEMDKSRDD